MGNLFVTIVLAAGESRRMGKPKLFLPVGEDTLLRQAVTAARDLGEPVIVVTGAYHQQIVPHLSDLPEVQLVHNPNWSEGMSGSIAAGVKSALAYAPQNFFITLADQPTMGVESLAFLADELYTAPGEIVAAWYPERLGVPAIFPARYAPQLLDGKGANGARRLIAAAGEKVRVVRFNTPPSDIDTPEDYANFLRTNRPPTA